MNTKHYLVVSGIVGGVIGSLLTALLVSPVTAQWEKFEVVECSKLRIVDEYGTKKIELGSALEDGYLEIRGYLKILGPESGNIPVILLTSSDERGRVFVRGDVSVLNDDLGYAFLPDDTTAMIPGQRVAQLSAGEDGTGSVSVIGKDYKGLAILKVIEHKGIVVAYGNDGKAKVGLGVDEHGGRVNVYGADGNLRSALIAGEHGGRVSVYGKGEGSAIMGINEYGNGAVSTWDKNGYRQ